MLDPEELDRRLKAIRMLRQISQTEMAVMLEAEGFGKHDLGRIERGQMALTGARRRELARILRVPESYFTAEDLDEVLFAAGTDKLTDDQIRRAAELMAPQLLEAARALAPTSGKEQQGSGARDQ